MSGGGLVAALLADAGVEGWAAGVRCRVDVVFVVLLWPEVGVR
ncbi:hypothetical protein AB0D27_28925 [Streptomyces sp. NPDC048415]